VSSRYSPSARRIARASRSGCELCSETNVTSKPSPRASGPSSRNLRRSRSLRSERCTTRAHVSTSSACEIKAGTGFPAGRRLRSSSSEPDASCMRLSRSPSVLKRSGQRSHHGRRRSTRSVARGGDGAPDSAIAARHRSNSARRFSCSDKCTLLEALQVTNCEIDVSEPAVVVRFDAVVMPFSTGGQAAARCW
jgi:hypothetical protein